MRRYINRLKFRLATPGTSGQEIDAKSVLWHLLRRARWAANGSDYTPRLPEHDQGVYFCPVWHTYHRGHCDEVHDPNHPVMIQYRSDTEYRHPPGRF